MNPEENTNVETQPEHESEITLEQQILDREQEILADEGELDTTENDESQTDEVEDGIQDTEEQESEEELTQGSEEEGQPNQEADTAEKEQLIDWDTAPSHLKAAYRRKVEEADKDREMLHKLMDKFQPNQQQAPAQQESQVPDKDADPEGHQDYVNNLLHQNTQQLQQNLLIQSAQNELSAADVRASNDTEYVQAKSFMESVATNLIKENNPGIDNATLQQNLQSAYLEGVFDAQSKGIPFEQFIKNRAKIYGFRATQQAQSATPQSKPNLAAIAQHKKDAGKSLGDADGKATKSSTTMDDLGRMSGAELIKFRDKNPKLFEKLTAG